MIQIALLVLTLLTTAASAQNQTVIRDDRGRTVGTVTRDSQGTVQTFRDAGGRTTGTATRSSEGTITFRDSRGTVTGRSYTR
jgi:hypothetical protein